MVTLYLGNKTNTIRLEDIEHYLTYNEWDSMTLQIATYFVILFMTLFNGSILKFMLEQKKKTFLDWIIVIDLSLCLGYLIALAMFVSNACHNELVCLFKIGISFFISILNRVLSVLVVIYRTFYVLKPHFVDTLTKRRTFCTFLLASSMILSVGSTVGMVIYRENYISFKGKILSWILYGVRPTICNLFPYSLLIIK